MSADATFESALALLPPRHRVGSVWQSCKFKDHPWWGASVTRGEFQDVDYACTSNVGHPTAGRALQAAIAKAVANEWSAK